MDLKVKTVFQSTLNEVPPSILFTPFPSLHPPTPLDNHSYLLLNFFFYFAHQGTYFLVSSFYRKDSMQ